MLVQQQGRMKRIAGEKAKQAGADFHRWWFVDSFENRKMLSSKAQAFQWKEKTRMQGLAADPVARKVENRKRQRSDMFFPLLKHFTSSGGTTESW